MSSQAEVHSIDALKDFRTALALYSEDTLSALGAVEAEVRRTGQWLQQERPYYWQEHIKRRHEQVASAKAEVFRRRLQKTPDYSPSLSEPMEILRRAEASLQDAEKRLLLPSMPSSSSRTDLPAPSRDRTQNSRNRSVSCSSAWDGWNRPSRSSRV